MIGARPARAMIVEDKKQILKNFRNMTKKQKEEAIEAFAEYAAENVPTAGNMRGSKEYRTLLVKVLTRRAWEAVGGMKMNINFWLNGVNRHAEISRIHC